MTRRPASPAGGEGGAIELRKGNILAADAEALVNAVNCVGVMGRGLALQCRKAFPGNFAAYAEACRRGEVLPGRMFVFETGQFLPPRLIVNFPTKRHWRDESLLEDIDNGLRALAEEIRDRGIRSIAVPALGCGLGGLDWADVRPRIEEALRGLPGLRVALFEAGGGPGADRAAADRGPLSPGSPGLDRREARSRKGMGPSSL